ncbi:MAG: hypothetical protein ABL977_07990 [Candidatus Eisenbacteria bacterium]
MRRLLALSGLVLGAAALVSAVGCGKLTGKLTGVPKGNQPPNTVLFVSGPVDTVNHIVHLFWFGTDIDGSVSSFEWRLDNPAAPADTGWHATALTDSVFTVFAPAGYTNPVFSVRAIDNTGARDPSPPVQSFEFSNQAPTVRLTTKPAAGDTTFASVSVVWSANDPDGDASKLTYLVWLDGHENDPEITTSKAFTMPSARFFNAGVLNTGPRKLFVRAIDDGGRAGPPDSCTWTVRRAVAGPRARLLIVDDVPEVGPNRNPSNLRFDTLYTNSAARVGLTTDQYTVLRLDTTQPFKTAADFAQTFGLFEVVVWYRGNEIDQGRALSRLLRIGEPGIAQYLDSGGRFYVDGLYLVEGVNAVGLFSEDFVRGHLGSRRMLGAFTTTNTFADTSIGFGNAGASVFLPHVDVRGSLARDSIYVRGAIAVRSGEAGGLRQFDPIDRGQVVLWGGLGTLTPDLGDSTAVGMSVPQPNGGRAIMVCTVPGGAVPAVGPGTNAGSAARFITNIFRHLGLDQ